MKTDNGSPLPPPFADLIAAVAAAHPMPPTLDQMTKPERMKHHRGMLRHIGFYKGLNGVQEYKKEFPEARSQRVDIKAIAYPPKPAGYDANLTSFAELWLTSDMAVAETNVADVGRLNARLGTHFPPEKHFSERVSLGRLTKIKDVFARHGMPLDIKRTFTMSNVRKAAKAARGSMDANRRPFGAVGFVVGHNLVVNGRSYLIERNGERKCIRPTIDGRRRRFYLDELEWIAEWLGAGVDDPLNSTTTVRSIRELPYSMETGGNETAKSGEISGLPYDDPAVGSPDRVATAPVPHSTPHADEDDPLNYLPHD